MEINGASVGEFFVKPSTAALKGATKTAVEAEAKVAKFNATKDLLETDTFKSAKNGTALTADQYSGLSKKEIVGAKKIDDSTFEITKKVDGKDVTYKVKKDTDGNLIKEGNGKIKKFEMDTEKNLSKTEAKSLTHWEKYQNSYLTGLAGGGLATAALIYARHGKSQEAAQ